MAYSRIQYNGINIDFDRGLSAFSPFPVQVKNVVRSRAGVAQTLNFYRYWSFAIGRLFASANLKNQVMAFWDYVRAGNPFSFWHDRDLMGYWNFEGKSYADINERTATFTRDSIAFYVNPTTGLLAEVASNVARFPTGKFGRGLLSERAATNLLTKSTEFSDASWNATNITVTDNYDTNGAPAESPYLGGADQVELTSTTGSFQKDVATNIGTQNLVFSVYLRTHEAGTKSGTLYIKREDTDDTLASQAITITPFWQRFSVNYVSAGDLTADMRVRIEISGASGNKFAIWGAMLEARSSIKSPSSFIYTTTTNASRNYEETRYTLSNFFDNEMIKGSLCFWYSSFAASPIGRTLIGAVLNDGFLIVTETADNLLEFSISTKTGGGITVSGTDPTSPTPGTFNHYAFTWDSTIANGLKIYVNGILLATSSNSVFSISRVKAATNYLYFGGDTADVGADGTFDDIEIWRDVLTAEDLAARARGLYTMGYDRNYFPALMIDEAALGFTHLPALPNWDLEIPVREAL